MRSVHVPASGVLSVPGGLTTKLLRLIGMLAMQVRDVATLSDREDFVCANNVDKLIGQLGQMLAAISAEFGDKFGVSASAYRLVTLSTHGIYEWRGAIEHFPVMDRAQLPSPLNVLLATPDFMDAVRTMRALEWN